MAAGTGALDFLPHREPFRFITSVDHLEPGVCASGLWVVRGDEGFFTGHFPGRPIVPGVLIGEALAQLSGIAGHCGGVETGSEALLSHVNIRFRAVVAPPARIALSSRLARSMERLRMYDVSASIGNSVVAEGTIVLGTPSET